MGLDDETLRLYQKRYEGVQITPTIAFRHTKVYRKGWFEIIVIDHLELIVLIGLLAVLAFGVFSIWYAVQGGG